MSNEEIALRLTEAWASQDRFPSSINEIISNYKYTLEEINKEAE